MCIIEPVPGVAPLGILFVFNGQVVLVLDEVFSIGIHERAHLCI